MRLEKGCVCLFGFSSITWAPGYRRLILVLLAWFFNFCYGISWGSESLVSGQRPLRRVVCGGDFILVSSGFFLFYFFMSSPFYCLAFSSH